MARYQLDLKKSGAEIGSSTTRLFCSSLPKKKIVHFLVGCNRLHEATTLRLLINLFITNVLIIPVFKFRVLLNFNYNEFDPIITIIKIIINDLSTMIVCFALKLFLYDRAMLNNFVKFIYC